MHHTLSMHRTLLAVVWVSWACGDETLPAPTDADVDVDAGWALQPPSSPRSPELGPCPDGWSASSEAAGDLVFDVCEPLPSHPCELGEAMFAGERECHGLGECSTGQFPTGLPSSGTIYVDADAAGGGTGSEAQPYVSLQDALARARPGTTVALARGVYDGPFAIPQGVTLWGTCAAETTLTRTDESLPVARATVSVFDPDVTLRNVSVTGLGAGIGVDGTGALALIAVQIHGVPLGLLAIGGQVQASELVVRDTRSSVTVPEGGVSLIGGAVGRFNDVWFDNVRRAFLVHAAGSELTLTGARLQIRAGAAGRAIAVQQGAAATLRETVLEGHGLQVSGLGTRVDAEHLVVRNGSRLGLAMSIGDGASGSLETTLVQSWEGIGLYLTRADTVRAGDVVIRDIIGEMATSVGVRDSRFEFERVALLRAQGSHLVAVGDEADVRGLDLIATATSVSPIPGSGLGISLGSGARVELERTLLMGNDTGINAVGGATLTLRDLQILDNPGAAPNFPGAGTGIAAFDNVVVRLERALVHGARVNGIGLDLGAELNAVDVRIEQTQQSLCLGDDACPSGAGHGFGLLLANSSATLQRFHIAESELCGIRVAGTADLQATQGRVTGNPVGLCIERPDFDPASASIDVSYDENERNLDRETREAPVVPNIVPDLP